MRIVLALIAALLSSSVAAYSSSTGIAGRTLLSTTPGCSCHNPLPTTSVAVSITGPATLLPGAVGSYTVNVTDAVGTTGGVDIAASAGTLSTASSGLKVLSGEIVHSSPRPVPSTYTFAFMAPPGAGIVTLAATAKGTDFTAWNNAPNFTITVTAATAVKPDPLSAPTVFELEQNYPNPFNPTTNIRFSIPETQHATLAIFDLQGREIALLVNSTLVPGTYSATWDAKNVPSGVYFYRLKAGNFTMTKKLLVQK
jgi:hypothetical protein